MKRILYFEAETKNRIQEERRTTRVFFPLLFPLPLKFLLNKTEIVGGFLLLFVFAGENELPESRGKENYTCILTSCFPLNFLLNETDIVAFFLSLPGEM